MELATDVRSALELAEDVGGFEVDRPRHRPARRLGARRRPQPPGDGSTVPILILTARDTVVDRVTGLDAGRRRLPRQAVRVRGARGAAPRARPARRRPRRAPRRPPPRGRRDRPRRGAPRGHRRRQAGRAQPARVLAARVLPAPPRRGADPRPAARPRLAVRAWRSPRTPSTPTSTTSATSSARPAIGSGRCAASATGSRTRRDRGPDR